MCMCYEDRYTLGNGEIDKFLGGSQQEIFRLRWIVAIRRWEPNAERAIENAHPQVTQIDFREPHGADRGRLRAGDGPADDGRAGLRRGRTAPYPRAIDLQDPDLLGRAGYSLKILITTKDFQGIYWAGILDWIRSRNRPVRELPPLVAARETAIRTERAEDPR